MEQKQETKKDKKGIWGRIFKESKLKKGKTAILFLKNNNIAEPMELESNKGFFHIDGKTYHEDRDCVYTLGKDRYPLAIIPEWSSIPFGTKSWHDKPMLEKFHSLEEHTIRGIRQAELVRSGEKDKDKLNIKTIVIIGILMIIALAFIMK